jgi:hypothetical protein
MMHGTMNIKPRNFFFTFPDNEEKGRNLLRNLTLIPIESASYPRTLESADFYLSM